MIALSNPEKIALLTDSTADLTPAMRAGKPIYVVPLKIRCDDGEFSDGVDIFAQDVYDRLHRGELPRTSLPEGGVVSDTLDQIRADGYEKVIAVMLSGGLSGTYNLVRVQAEQRDDLDIAVFDSRSGSLGIGIIVLQLWEEIQAGAGWDKLIHERVPLGGHPGVSAPGGPHRPHHRPGGHHAVHQAHHHLFRGRPAPEHCQGAGTKAGAGQESIAKVRGRKQVQDKIVELLRSKFRAGKRYNLGVANGGAPAEMAELSEKIRARFPDFVHCWEGAMDATLSVYIGDGVIGGGIQFID